MPAAPENAGMLRALDLTAEDKAAIKYLSFLTLKPTMYIANVNEDGFENNPYTDTVRKIADAEGSVVVAVCRRGIRHRRAGRRRARRVHGRAGRKSRA